MPTDNRATAERLAREVYEKFAAERLTRRGCRIYSTLGETDEVFRERAIECALSGLTHRDRTAEREAARKAWDAAVQAVAEFTHDDPRAITYQSLGQYRSALSRHMETVIKHDLARYLAAEFDAGERVTLSDGSVVTRSGYIIRREHAGEAGAEGTNISSWELLIRRTDTGADFDAVKRLAEQRGAER